MGKFRSFLTGRLKQKKRLQQFVAQQNPYGYIAPRWESLNKVGRCWKLSKINIRATQLYLRFSPSGYEIQKNTSLADYVFYLPIDTPKRPQVPGCRTTQSRCFHQIRILVFLPDNPQEKKYSTYLVSARFRPNQPFSNGTELFSVPCSPALPIFLCKTNGHCIWWKHSLLIHP